MRNSGTGELLSSGPKTASVINSNNNNNRSLLELTSSLENDSILNSFTSTTSPDSGFCYKMSSDSAFQSLGDGIELEDEKHNVSPVKVKSEPSKIEIQMKAIAEEAKKRRLARGCFLYVLQSVLLSFCISFSGIAEVPKYGRRNSDKSTSNRFMTQPVTVDEVQEATKLNDTEDPAGKFC